MIVSRLAHAAFDVPDVELALRFYEEVLGLGVLYERAGAVYLGGGRSSTYELVLREGPVRVDHFAFAVRDADALGIGPELDCADDPGIAAGRVLAFPSGHAVELVQEAEPRGYVPASAAAPRHHRGAGPVQIEHITLLSGDIEADARFAVERLGLRLTDSVQPPGAPWRNTHLRAGGLHHDLGLLPHDGDGPLLHHLCFAVPSVAEVVRTADALAARGMALDASIGRHVSGNNVFVYFKDPFGIRLEVNADMARVDAAAPPLILTEPVPFDAWRAGRPPALAGGSPA